MLWFGPKWRLRVAQILTLYALDGKQMVVHHVLDKSVSEL